ncbi:cupin domain-containing protein [Streptomyces sp. NPDC057565]|uniref:cupin domain-containing protein n=1 Tax=Streptomyces sp. NPDC057565 TaxID=3346169 RepID=UPI00367AB957
MVSLRGETETLVAHTGGLGWLLQPITCDDFLNSTWGQQSLLIRRDQSDYFQDLPGIDEVDEMITNTMSGGRAFENDASRLVRSDATGCVSERAFRMTSTGLPDVQHIYQAYHEGYTLILNGVHRRSSKIANLSRALEASLHHPVGVNMYLTPSHSQGFDLHTDDHDVFVLQLHGTKVWHVANAGTLSPLAERSTRPLEHSDLQTLALRPGDVLYIPRGYAHRAQAAAASSLHLTVGIHAFRWADLMTETIRLLSDENSEFGGALSPGFLDQEIDLEVVEKLGNHLVQALLDESLARRAKESLGTRLISSGKAASAGHFRSLDRILQLTHDSFVRRTRVMYHRIRSKSSEVAIEFDGNFVSGPPFLENALLFIAEHEIFQVDGLPEIGTFPPSAKIELVSRLIREGFLTLADDALEDNYET